MEGFNEGRSGAVASELVGKDELGLKANLAGFVVPNSAQTKALLAQAKFGSPTQVDGSYVQIDDDMFMVVIDHRAADIVGILWVGYEGEERSFTNESGKTITFRSKRLIGWKSMGRGESGVDDALAEIGEIRTGIELQAMRALGGFARHEHDAGEGDDGLDYEDEMDELRALMED